MKAHHKSTGICYMSGKHLPKEQLISGTSIRKNIFDLIKQDYPDFEVIHFVSTSVLNRYRNKYLENLLNTYLYG